MSADLAAAMTRAPKDIPIIFSAPMVRALLDGRKTQTRRLASSPLAKALPGDRLWARECWSDQDCRPGEAMYRASAIRDGLLPEEKAEMRWRPSIHMPRWASRLTLVVEEVRVQRIQKISEADALAEGVEFDPGPCDHARQSCEDIGCDGGTASGAYRVLWDSLHAKPGERWDDNPFVVALTFSVHRCNIDAFLAARGGPTPCPPAGIALDPQQNLSPARTRV